MELQDSELWSWSVKEEKKKKVREKGGGRGGKRNFISAVFSCIYSKYMWCMTTVKWLTKNIWGEGVKKNTALDLNSMYYCILC